MYALVRFVHPSSGDGCAARCGAVRRDHAYVRVPSHKSIAIGALSGLGRGGFDPRAFGPRARVAGASVVVPFGGEHGTPGQGTQVGAPDFLAPARLSGRLRQRRGELGLLVGAAARARVLSATGGRR